MAILQDEHRPPRALSVVFQNDLLTMELDDGRAVSVPLAWFLRLLKATQAERANFRLIGHGQGVHWPEIDEDVSVDAVLKGNPSTESAGSYQRWLEAEGRG